MTVVVGYRVHLAKFRTGGLYSSGDARKCTIESTKMSMQDQRQHSLLQKTFCEAFRNVPPRRADISIVSVNASD